MYRVTKGNKIRNIISGDQVKTFEEFDILPAEYKIPEDYIKNKIVEEVIDVKIRKTR